MPPPISYVTPLLQYVSQEHIGYLEGYKDFEGEQKVFGGVCGIFLGVYSRDIVQETF